jgi:hypothetical protein
MAEIGTTSKIRRHVFQLPFGQMFFTRDCLNYGPRSAVDQALYRLVKAGDITRLGRGVFVRLISDTRIPTIAEVAVGKAKAFGRKLFLDSSKAMRKCLRQTVEGGPHTFATDGATTSFRCMNERIYFKRHAPRKIMLRDSAHGLVIRALWALGPDAITDDLVRDTTSALGRIEMADLRRSCNVMPAWLADLLVFRFTSRS